MELSKIDVVPHISLLTTLCLVIVLCFILFTCILDTQSVKQGIHVSIEHKKNITLKKVCVSEIYI